MDSKFPDMLPIELFTGVGIEAIQELEKERVMPQRLMTVDDFESLPLTDNYRRRQIENVQEGASEEKGGN